MIKLLLAGFFLITSVLPVQCILGESVKARVFAPSGIETGNLFEVRILMESTRQLGGIDLTIRYNDSLFSFVSVEQDTGLNNWEYFQPAHDPIKNTVNMFCIADIVNGPITPDSADYYPKGSVAKLTFFALWDWNDSTHQVFPFHWGLCGDNAAANKRGDTLILLNTVRDYNGALLWVEPDNVNYPESSRLPFIGAPDSCLVVADKILFEIDLQFGAAKNYSICGDADANDIVNVSDVVYLIAYIFGSGPAPNPPTAGDVDCNGLVTISDGVYLIGYIFAGGPPPCACP